MAKEKIVDEINDTEKIIFKDQDTTFKEKCKICGKAKAEAKIKSNIATKRKLDLSEKVCPKCGARYVIKDKKIMVLSVDLCKDKGLD